MTDASAPNSPTREPNIKGWPGLPDLMKYYPPDAERQGIEVMVDIHVHKAAQVQQRVPNVAHASLGPLYIG